MKRIFLSFIVLALFLNANCQNKSLNLFPVYGITPSKTSIKEITKLGFKCKDKNCDVNGLAFWDFDGDKIVEEIYMVQSNPMPKDWMANYGFNWSLSYSEWILLFKKYNFKIQIDNEPNVSIYSGRNTLSAKFEAKSPTGNAKLILDFNYGNDKGEGYLITSKNSLYSISIKTFGVETELDISQGIIRRNFKRTEDYLKAKYWEYSLEEGYYNVKLNGKEGVCDLSGKEIIPCNKYNNVILYSSGWYGVKLDGKEGACDLIGKEIVPCKYDNVVLQSGYYNVKLNGKEGACNLAGTEIIPCKYDKVVLQNGWYDVYINGKKGACNLAGTEVIPCKYDNVLLLTDHYYVKLNGNEGSCDLNGNVIVAIPENTVVENLGIKLSGNWSYSMDFSEQTTHITGAKIINNESSTSGTVKISLYLTDTKYAGGSINGYALANYKFDQLEGGYYYHDVDKQLNFDASPPSGNYYVTLLLLEYTNDGFIIRDYLSFDDLLAFDSRKTERVLNAIAEGLNSLSNSLNNSNNNSYSNLNNTNNNTSSGHMEFVTCTYCKGTGNNPSPSQGTCFGQEHYHWCDVCKKEVPCSHGAHLKCPSCNGKGQIKKWVP